MKRMEGEAKKKKKTHKGKKRIEAEEGEEDLEEYGGDFGEPPDPTATCKVMAELRRFLDGLDDSMCADEDEEKPGNGKQKKKKG
mmetsp:Transcript_1531/g.3282  ORF Transcript_1531/g.3282 Transcript_1531/m.3282 type:complete len:84 (+) Transcript_1531:2-253(+)